MGQLAISGTLIAGPPQSSGTGAFPGTVATAPLATYANPKQFQRGTGILERTITSAAPAFLDLGEPGNVVTQADFLYFKSDAPLTLRLTTDDGAGGDVVAVVPIHGLAIMEFNSTNFLKTLEAQGTAKVEYFLSGNQ